MSATLTEYDAKHAGGWYDPEHSRLDDYTPRHSAEVARNRAEARRELVEFIRTDDGRDSGRAL